MIIQTDVKCLYCGHVSWRIEMEQGAPWSTAEMVWPEPGGELPARPTCARCGGPVYLDPDYRRVRNRQSEVRTKVQRLRAEARSASGSTQPSPTPARTAAARGERPRAA